MNNLGVVSSAATKMYKIEMNADVVFCFIFVSLQDYLKERHNSLKEATVSRHDYYYDGRVLFLKKALLYCTTVRIVRIKGRGVGGR